MPLEVAGYLHNLVSTNPEGEDSKSAGDDHIRLLKVVLQATFPGLAGRFARVQAKTSSYALLPTDNLTVIVFTAGSSLSLTTSTASQVLGNGFSGLCINISGTEVTFDPQGVETINAQATLILPTNFAFMYWTDGLTWYGVILPMTGSALPVGATFCYPAVVPPVGFVFASGRTLGNPSSGATERANVDTQLLYAMLWANWDNTVLPIESFDGTLTTRGASAALDFANSKRLPVPDFRDRVPAGWGLMGGISANRLTGLAGGLDGDLVGATGGAESHVLVLAEMPEHNHDVTDPGHVHIYGSPSTFAGGGLSPVDNMAASTTAVTAPAVTGITLEPQGGDGAHNNVQPTIVIPWIIKL